MLDPLLPPSLSFSLCHPLPPSLPPSLLLVHMPRRLSSPLLSSLQEELSLSSSLYVHTITQKLKWYPILSILIWIVPTFHRVSEFCSWEPYPLSLVSLLIYSSLGFLDSLIYYSSSRATSCWSELLLPLLSRLFFSQQQSNSHLKTSLLSSDPSPDLSEVDEIRPSQGTAFRGSQSSSSRIVFHKRISFTRGQLQQHEVRDSDAYGDTEEERVQEEKNEDDSSSDEAEVEMRDSEAMSILSWIRGAPKHKQSFLDLDFPLESEETIE
jgi:hypothetical protein